MLTPASAAILLVSPGHSPPSSKGERSFRAGLRRSDVTDVERLIFLDLLPVSGHRLARKMRVHVVSDC